MQKPGWALMLSGHDLSLVTLSVAVAILGGYTGFGLAARIRGTPNASHRLLLASAAGFLAIGIWTMHFVGMLAAPLPADASYLVLPTIVSFLICALVVGVSLFFVSVGEPSLVRVSASAALLGVGIASMHYVGMHALSGPFTMHHDLWWVIASILIAIAAAYGGLRIFIARQGGIRLAASAVAFGVAVSGMHYTAMSGAHLVPGAAGDGGGHHMEGLVASQQILALVVALLCFVIAAGFLLSLMPDRRRDAVADATVPEAAIAPAMRPTPLPLGGIGQPRTAPVERLPVEGAGGTHFVDAAEIRSIHADAHYTRVHDGSREWLCPWSISEAEAQLDPARFVRVHRSYIVALAHVASVRREGDGAVIQLDGTAPHRIPVSRAKVADVKARLGLVRRGAGAG